VLRFAILTSITCALLTSATTASAQSVGVGYQFLRAFPSDSSAVNYPLGVNVDVAVPVFRQWQALGEFGWSRNGKGALGTEGTLTATSYGGGVRFATTARWHPYAQFIVGYHRDAINDFNETTVMVQPGGGASYAFGERFRLFGQADLRRILYDDILGAENDLRLVAGVRLQLSR
jgi:hypothetical protein